MTKIIKYLFYSSIILLSFSSLMAQKPYRTGTSTATFLEVGYGETASSMGDAFTSVVNDVSATYWNPAGLANLTKNEVMFSFQPWYADINTSFIAGAFVMENLGTFAISIIGVDYGDMDVTTLQNQEGTGETFSASDIAVSVGYARKLAEWFSFGAMAKYVSSTIWHSSGNAFAIDLGILINTGFFSPTGNTEDGLNIAMSISNYGTPLQFDGMDLLQPIDPTPGSSGDFKDVEGQFTLREWELPLIFRLGISTTLIKSGNHTLIISADAIHPNNNSESLNLGMLYSINFPGLGNLNFSGGYKALFMDQSEYGLSFGTSFHSYLLYNQGWKISYAFRDHETFGGTHSYGVSIFF